MKNIGILHYQVGRMDGVSLEIEKWQRVLEEMGHRVELCAGDLSTAEGTLVEEMYHHRPEVARLYSNTFECLHDYADENAYRNELMRVANVLERKLRTFVENKAIDLLIPENVWSVGLNPALSIALARVMRDLKIPALAHNHDFYWERETGVALSCGTAIELAEKYLPPRGQLVQHTVINSLAQQELAERKGLKARVVPNVFDFQGTPWGMDEYNHDFRERIGLRTNDLLILQATRITPRKGIELAIDFVQALDSPARRARLEERGLYDGRAFGPEDRIVLVMAGYARDDLSGNYVERLKDKIARTGVDAVFIEDLIEGRRQTRGGEKIYSLWDSYVFADLVTYPSLDEGWGNQLLEAVYARQPLLVFEYPVYRADIKNTGFQVISLGSEIEDWDERGLARVSPAAVEAAADEAVEMLTRGDLRREVMEHNFQVGRQNFSLKTLHDCLAKYVGEDQPAVPKTPPAHIGTEARPTPA
jgi:glycosyltransferase involved in cell wall biosynthesis